MAAIAAVPSSKSSPRAQRGSRFFTHVGMGGSVVKTNNTRNLFAGQCVFKAALSLGLPTRIHSASDVGTRR